MERSEDTAIAREKMYSRIGKARRAAGAAKREEFPVSGCPLPRSELAILTLRDKGFELKEIAERHGCSLIGVKKLTRRTRDRVSDLIDEDVHSTDFALQYVKEQGWLAQYQAGQKEQNEQAA